MPVAQISQASTGPGVQLGHLLLLPVTVRLKGTCPMRGTRPRTYRVADVHQQRSAAPPRDVLTAAPAPPLDPPHQNPAGLQRSPRSCLVHQM